MSPKTAVIIEIARRVRPRADSGPTIGKVEIHSTLG